MSNTGGLMNYEFNIAPFKEPRGFIKVLQWVFAICAFATTVNYSGEVGLRLQCSTGNKTELYKTTIEYPFALDETKPIEISPDCAKPNTSAHNFLMKIPGNSRSDAQYFVCTGVLSFLYAMAGGALYLMWEKVYQTDNKVPVIDFAITLVLAIFWISAVAAWGKGVSSLSEATSPDTLYHYNSKLNPGGYPAKVGGIDPSFSKLVISILFGVINFVLWTGNLWFLYKETTWFESIMKHSLTNAAGPSSAGNI